MVSGSASLQDELENIENIVKKYTPLAQAAQTQTEMNLSSRWFFDIWDTELNNLLSRFSDLADPQTKEKILAEQRNWIAMKEEVTLLHIGSYEENGSMYPLLQNSYLEEITKNRAYVIANELAKIKGNPLLCRKNQQSTVCLWTIRDWQRIQFPDHQTGAGRERMKRLSPFTERGRNKKEHLLTMETGSWLSHQMTEV